MITRFYYNKISALHRKRLRVLSFIEVTHQVIHSFLATACRSPSLPHRKVTELYFYYFVFPLMRVLPNPFCGWYFLHMAYGAGYYQYRLTLIGVVDNFKVVPLHAWGYITWRDFWRQRLYPWLVKKFPRWGYFTTLLVWSQHLFVGQGITSFFGIKFLDLLNLTVFLRYRAPLPINAGYDYPQLFQPYELNPSDSKAADVLIDQETLSLDNVFPFPRFEPFQEESLGYFEDQQDMNHEDDEEPNQTFDIQYGTNEGAYLMEEDPYYFFRETRHRYRRRNRLTRKLQPYREVTNDVTSFILKLNDLDFSKRTFTLGRLIDPGQAPSEIDDEPDDELYLSEDDEPVPSERRDELADWFFLSLRSNNITDLDLFHTDFGGSLWRIHPNLWVSGILSRPFRHYSAYRGWFRWWWYSRRVHARHYYKEMKAAGREFRGYSYYYRPTRPTAAQLRQKLRIKYKTKATFKVDSFPAHRAHRRWWSSPRRQRQDQSFFEWEWLQDESVAFISRQYSHRTRYLSRQWHKVSTRWFRTNSGVNTFFTDSRFHQRRQFLTQFPNGLSGHYRWGRRTPPSTHVYYRRPKLVYDRYENIVWSSKKYPNRERVRLVYPRYQPAYSVVASPAGGEVNEVGFPYVSVAPPTGVGLVLIAVLTSFFLVWVPLLSFFYTQEPWDFAAAEVSWQKTFGNNLFYLEVRPGLPSWIEVYRSAPPRGFPSRGAYPASIDANIYVWSWFVDFWSTS